MAVFAPIVFTSITFTLLTEDGLKDSAFPLKPKEELIARIEGNKIII